MVGSQDSLIVEVDPEGLVEGQALGVHALPARDHDVGAVVAERSSWGGQRV